MQVLDQVGRPRETLQLLIKGCNIRDDGRYALNMEKAQNDMKVQKTPQNTRVFVKKKTKKKRASTVEEMEIDHQEKTPLLKASKLTLRETKATEEEIIRSRVVRQQKGAGDNIGCMHLRETYGAKSDRIKEMVVSSGAFKEDHPTI